jgi:hypothetical protein
MYITASERRSGRLSGGVARNEGASHIYAVDADDRGDATAMLERRATQCRRRRNMRCERRRGLARRWSECIIGPNIRAGVNSKG